MERLKNSATVTRQPAITATRVIVAAEGVVSGFTGDGALKQHGLA